MVWQLLLNTSLTSVKTIVLRTVLAKMKTHFTPKKGTKLRLLKQKRKGHIYMAELYTVTPSDLLF